VIEQQSNRDVANKRKRNATTATSNAKEGQGNVSQRVTEQQSSTMPPNKREMLQQ
jgi:hypothetical protein